MLRRATALLAVVAALVSCAADASDGTEAASDVASSTSPPALDVDAAVAAAIDVRADGCGPRIGFGTGTVIDGGDIVTAAHVVAGSTAVEVIDVDGARSAAAVVLLDADLDFAVLRPTTAIGTPLAIRGDEAQRGESGVVVRIREIEGQVDVERIEVSVVREANISTTDISLERDVVRDGFEIESAIDPGDSGAMVVLPGGGVGIVWARSNKVEGRAWAIDLPANVIDRSALGRDLEPVDVGDCIP